MSTDHTTSGSRKRWVLPLLSLAVLIIVAFAIREELRASSYQSVVATLRALPTRMIVEAILATMACYLVLPCYDLLGLRYAQVSIPTRAALTTSWFAYAFSQTLGFAAITGGAFRLRFWTEHGLTTPDVARAAVFSAIGFWIGLLGAGGLALTFETLPAAVVAIAPAALLRATGVVLLLTLAAYLVLASVRTAPITVAGVAMRMPGPKLTVAQVVVAMVDWALAGTVLWVLLPSGDGMTFAAFLGAFALAQGVGLASHVPGGIGVFDSLMVLLLSPAYETTGILASLIAYRAIYYLLPFLAAAIALVVLFLRRRRAMLTKATRASVELAGKWGSAVLPGVLSAATFVSGVVLLVSGAVPAERGRIAFLDRLLPLGVIEVSHLTGSLLGATLLVLSWALSRRLDAAWALSVVALAAGVVASLLKGLDVEEALILATVLAVLIPSREVFHRRAALLAEPLEPEWIVAVVTAIGASIAFGLFAFKHVEYNADLWWRFSRNADAPRFLRASVVVFSGLIVLAFARLMRHAPGEPELPDADALERVQRIVTTSTDTRGHIALLGDKAVLLDEQDRAMLMYGVEGRSWIALGDPIGQLEAGAELAWRFREMADRHGGWPVFYEVGTARLPLYIDLGLSLLKLGEEAIVLLQAFSLDGPERKGLRRAVRDAEKREVSFELVPATETAALLPTLHEISNAWLEAKNVREKGFSLGRFDEAYLRRQPIALLRHQGKAVGFANVLQAGNGTELSVDLMRFTPAAPGGVMDYLFTELMLWGHAQGYQRFNLGMAPLSGLEPRALAPLWNRAGTLVFRFGEHFYNFRGLRQYKEKFDPVWEPRYLASPGGLALPRILTNVASLISGGLGGLVRK